MVCWEPNDNTQIYKYVLFLFIVTLSETLLFIWVNVSSVSHTSFCSECITENSFFLIHSSLKKNSSVSVLISPLFSSLSFLKFFQKKKRFRVYSSIMTVKIQYIPDSYLTSIWHMCDIFLMFLSLDDRHDWNNRSYLNIIMLLVSYWRGFPYIWA